LASLITLYPHLIITPFPISWAKIVPCPTNSGISTWFLVVRLFIALMMEGVHTSEMLVYLSKTVQHFIPEGYHLHSYCHWLFIITSDYSQFPEHAITSSPF
jgi:hypothetical protein